MLRIGSPYVRLLVVVLMVTCALFVGLGAARAVSSRYVFAGDALIEVGDRMPASDLVPAILRTESEDWDRESISRILGPELAAVAVPATRGSDESGSWMHLERGGVVRWSMSFGGFYYTGDTPYSRPGSSGPSIDASGAVMAARKYVKDHGGMPNDAELWTVRDVVSVPLSLTDGERADPGSETSTRECVGRYVEFRHQVAGLEVDGPDGGDRIKVRVDGSGAVAAYGRVWSAVSTTTPVGKGGIAPVRARDALARAVAAGGPSKGRLKGRVELVDARLVYVRSLEGAAGEVLRPTWRFVIDGGSGRQKLFVDAGGRGVLDRVQ